MNVQAMPAQQAPDTLTGDGSPVAGTRPTRQHLWVREVMVVLGFKYIYDLTRRLAFSTGASPRAFSNANHLVAWERSFGIYNEVSLQHLFLSAAWLVRCFNVYYGALHLPVTAAVLIWLFCRHHDKYPKLRNLLGASTAFALVAFCLFPVAPPRLREWDGFVDTLDSLGGLWSYHEVRAAANPFAAMPSLHFGWALWCIVAVFGCTRSRYLRAAIVAHATLTLLAIVVTANHYWLDAIGGAVVLSAGWLLLIVIDAYHGHRDAVAPSFSAAARV